MRCVLAHTVDLEITDHHMAFSIESEINEWIRHEHSYGIEHVCVMLSVGDHQQILGPAHRSVSSNATTVAASASNSKKPVAGIAQAGHDETSFVQALVNGRGKYRNFGKMFVHPFDSLWRGNEMHQTDPVRVALAQQSQ